jgi:predicted dithiol-disulfide oxidoreductase (DUF899 family)
MPEHKTGTREEWRKARLELLEREKEHTRRGDELAKERRELPWVRVDKDYVFDTDDGPKSLDDLFDGRSQLLVYHFMFGPDWELGCPICSSIADHFNGFFRHLNNHDVTMLAVSRAPLEKIQRYKQRMGWEFPWASSAPGDFNFDYSVSFTEQEQREGAEYNWQTLQFPVPAEDDVEAIGGIPADVGATPADFLKEAPGMSAFILADGVVYHTYSAYARGLDALWSMYQWLDRAPLGRNEEGAPRWIYRHDEYPVAVH